ncbi:MAG: 50S ribosomal protein L18 [Desulfobulbaceae bacterium]|nr:50S ribosomal protein L18 [Desulfobulbaceae bacterium]
MAKTNPTVTARKKRALRVRTKVRGTAERPRMSVYRSNRHIYVQIIDDTRGVTLLSCSSENKAFNAAAIKGKCEQAKEVGRMVAEKAKAAGIEQVVFDRGGNLYHGRIRSLSEGAREAGLVF